MIRPRYQVVAVDQATGELLPEIDPKPRFTRWGAFRLLDRLEAARRATSWSYSVEART